MRSWSYRLTPQDEALAARIGFARQEPFLGQPERNRNYSEGDIWELWQHCITASSEIAVARMLGMEDFVPSVNTFKSEPDVGLWEVRYKFPGSDISMRFSSVDNPDAPYILVVGGPTEKTRRSPEDGYLSPPFEALGWIWGRDGMTKQYDITTFVDRRPRFRVPVEDLRSMDEIFVDVPTF